MKSGNIIQDKSFALAILTIRIVRKLQTEKREYILSCQLLKSATSVGANIEESIGAQSRRDFLSKISIAYKEVRETIYWNKLLYMTELLTKDEFENILRIAEECCRIIGKIQTTIRSKGFS
ncbi:MAG TPA: four helix bundle protein [Saprospiraceae bacterium]|nr:four helix bundle protein [Saprospiraceae bacterium]